MLIQNDFVRDPLKLLQHETPDEPVFFFSPQQLRETAQQFLTQFPGEVTYAVKANPDPSVLATLVQAGIEAFDVASPDEMALVRAALPTARLHYHNPIRSRAEIDQARDMAVVSWSVDRLSELDKLGDIAGVEIAIRLKLPVKSAAYDFGSKFGATPDQALHLLRTAKSRGAVPSITFHPGTQCHDPQAWVSYIEASANLARRAGVILHRLNVGGGFPAHRDAQTPDLSAIFKAISGAVHDAFETPPALVCEPGRAMVAEAFQLALQVKSAQDAVLYLNDGIYGGLSEWRDLGPASRIAAFSPAGQLRCGASTDTIVFGPTCDSLDRLSEHVALPDDIAEGDYLIFAACGAYSTALCTRFNGYGARRVVTLIS